MMSPWLTPKLESTRLLVKYGRDTENKKYHFRLYASWMNTERTVQIKSVNKKYSCARTFSFGHLASLEWITVHLVQKTLLEK
ncbi:hypothetical protein LXL04_024533 [Taraxacum kok-saghyz]